MSGQETHENSADSVKYGVLAGLVTLATVVVLVGGLAALDSGPVSPAQAQSGPTEISDWTDLNDTRTDLSGDYVLVNDLNKSTPGYDAVVANRTATEFSEDRFDSFNQSDTVTLTRTPLDSVTATNGSGLSINVTITDAANGTVVFQENPGDGFSSITFDYVTAAEQFVGFDPIGDPSFGERFTGTFDGQGNTIADLRINRPTEDRVGLFGATGAGGNVVNVSVTNATVNGSSFVGGLVGSNFESNVTESAASGSVNGEGAVGGLVGSNSDGNVTESAASGSVNGEGAVGGLVGSNGFDGTVTESAANGSVTGEFRVGGLVGFNLDENVTGARASGSVTGESRVGGLVGEHGQGTLSESFAVGNVTGSTNVGGVVGQLGGFLDPGEEAIVRDSYFDNQTTGQSAAVGTIDEGDGTAETRGEVTGLTTSQMQGQSAETTMSTLDFQTTWTTVTNPDDYPALQAFVDPRPPSLPGSDDPPQDPDGDGLYEDTDGDGEFDIFDVQAFFVNYEKSVVQNNVGAFDFDGDSEVDIFDVQAVFNDL